MSTQKTNENFLNLMSTRLLNHPIYPGPQVAVIQNAVAIARKAGAAEMLIKSKLCAPFHDIVGIK